jgi:dTDP-4-dehydrorhamnose reductase
MTIYIIGEHSFLAKHVYVLVKKQFQSVLLFSHDNIENIPDIHEEDIMIDFCGVNRADNEDDYYKGNFLFTTQLLQKITKKCYFMYISSLMVYGFKDRDENILPNYQKWFIQSKLKSEKYLIENYPTNKLCIIRPSNIFGYDCEPYYNNLISTLVYEKIQNYQKISKINTNCYRNFLSVEGFSENIFEFIQQKKNGIWNFLSNNTISLSDTINIIYSNNLPTHIELQNGNEDRLNLNNLSISGDHHIIHEDFKSQLQTLESDMRIYINLKLIVKIQNLNVLTQSRGEMVEISSLHSKRLYKITLNNNVIRGNHFHFKQTEEFYIDRGKVTFLLAFSDNPIIILKFNASLHDLITIPPNIIHTLINDYVDNISEVIVTSTQEYIAGIIPDTEYIKII